MPQTKYSDITHFKNSCGKQVGNRWPITVKGWCNNLVSPEGYSLRESLNQMLAESHSISDLVGAQHSWTIPTYGYELIFQALFLNITWCTRGWPSTAVNELFLRQTWSFLKCFQASLAISFFKLFVLGHSSNYYRTVISKIYIPIC